MATATRILAAGGHQLAAIPKITFTEQATGRGHKVLVPSHLPRLAPGTCARTVTLPFHLNWSEPGRAFDQRYPPG